MFRPLDDHSRASKLVIGIILLIALAARLGWALTRPTDAGTLANLPDQLEYLSLSQSLLSGHGLEMVDPRFNEPVQAFRMPGYPLFCAAMGGNVLFIRIAQAILDTLTVLATFWLARRWLSPMGGYLSAMFVALDPIGLYFTSLVLSETLYVALMTWGVGCLAHGRSPMTRGPGGTLWWMGIVLLIASVYVRPAALPFPLLLAAASVIHDHGKTSFKPGTRLPVLTLVALLTATALLPWAIRNRAVIGSWNFTTTNDGFTLYDAWNRDADGSSNQSGITKLPLLKTLNEGQRSDYLKSLAMEEVRRSPWTLIERIPTNLGRLWTPWPLSAEFGQKRAYVIGAAGHAIPLFALALLGILMRTSISRSGKLLLFMPVLIITVAHGLTLGSLRYRMPIHPELAVLAVSALAKGSRMNRYEDSAEAA